MNDNDQSAVLSSVDLESIRGGWLRAPFGRFYWQRALALQAALQPPVVVASPSYLAPLTAAYLATRLG